jgi:ubiquinone biosynthesis monooxygenase Coq7
MNTHVTPTRGDVALSVPDALTVSRIVKVNHAGEYGAIRIYSAQITVARRLFPEVVPALAEMLEHEKRHCAAFRDAMPERNSRPCRIMSLWGWGGWLLGALTAVTGQRGIWTCTAAVEEAVHRHLDDQLYFLKERDADLHEIIRSIQEEEQSHLRYAESRITSSNGMQGALRALIAGATDLVIWLSTWGASSRMARELHTARERIR